MPIQSPLQILDRTISQLTTKRADLLAQVEEIDAMFSRYGIVANGTAKRRPGRPPKLMAGTPGARKGGGKGSGRRKRGSFSRTAEEMILAVLPASTSEINAAWKKEGRGGSADNTLSNMVKAKKIKRVANKEGRGSMYSKA